MTDKLHAGRLNLIQTIRLLFHLPTLARLLFRLLTDTGVGLAAKMLFLGGLVFIASPFDVPNFVPVLGEMSDVMLALLACRWFINSCPAELVAAHVSAIGSRRDVAALA